MKTDLNTSKNIDTPFLKVRGNCLEIKNTTIQLSNISLFSTADIAPAKFPIFSVVLVLVGFLLLEWSVVPALIAIALGGGWIFYWYSSVQKAKDLKRLTIGAVDKVPPNRSKYGIIRAGGARKCS